MHVDLDQSDVTFSEDREKDVFFANDQEARVVASLVEKQMTTPDNYPLTLNSVCLACNQKSSREPVMSLSSGEVLRSLGILVDKKLVFASAGGRSEKFEHRLGKALGVERAALSLITVMVLRGPQTLSELKTRTARMHVFDDLDDVELELDELIERDVPLVKNLGKVSGQREERYAQLLRGDVQIDDIKVIPTRKMNEVATLKARILELEQQVECLKVELAAAKSGSDPHE